RRRRGPGRGFLGLSRGDRRRRRGSGPVHRGTQLLRGLLKRCLSVVESVGVGAARVGEQGHGRRRKDGEQDEHAISGPEGCEHNGLRSAPLGPFRYPPGRERGQKTRSAARYHVKVTVVSTPRNARMAVDKVADSSEISSAPDPTRRLLRAYHMHGDAKARERL